MYAKLYDACPVRSLNRNWCEKPNDTQRHGVTRYILTASKMLIYVFTLTDACIDTCKLFRIRDEKVKNIEVVSNVHFKVVKVLFQKVLTITYCSVFVKIIERVYF